VQIVNFVICYTIKIKMNINEINIEDNFIIIISDNESEKIEKLKKDVQTYFIQFHFILKGKIDFLFNQGSYKLSLTSDRHLMLYNPNRELPLDIDIYEKSVVVTLLITIKKFHQLFSQDSEQISFLSKENINQKFYNEKETTKSISLSLNQIYNSSLSQFKNKLFLKSKVYEIFSLIFMKNDENNEQCPYIMSDDQIQKIKKAKEIITTKYNNPPTLMELSYEINLSLRKLKEGFKELYGKPVFQYLLDYKMDLAKKMLNDGSYNVNEVSFELGYSTASHFISAFKKKFDITPKQYLKNNY